MRKVYPDTDIKNDLKNNEGFLFIDRATPSDIVFVISILKNGCDVWDQTIKMNSWVRRCMEKGKQDYNHCLLEGKERKKSKV